MFSGRTDWPSEENPYTFALNRLRKSGAKLLDLTVSNPTLCHFSYLNQELLKALTPLQAITYDPDPHGLLIAREALCRYYEKQNIKIYPDQIFLTANTSEVYSFIFKLLFDHGDRLIAPAPSYPLLDYLAEISDISVSRYRLVYSKDWEMELESLSKLFSSEAKAFLVVNPNNPTGNYITFEERTKINEACIKHSCAVISDEVFFDFPLDPSTPRQSFLTNDRVLTFTLGGISKMLGLPQMKLSWLIVSGPDSLKKEALRRLEVISDTFLSASTPVQLAFPKWLEQVSVIQAEIQTRIRKNHETLEKVVAGSKQVTACSIQGGWNAVLRFSDSLNDEERTLRILEQKQTVIYPGYLFDFEEDCYGVISLLVPPEIFREGLLRLV